jgi:hypothetical protein
MWVGGMILQRLGLINEPASLNLVSSAFLRLYLLHPLWANTGSAQVRNALLKSAEDNADSWYFWVSAMDE